MCDLKSRGMSVVCTWESRGIFFLTLVLFVLFSHGAVRCFVFLRMYRTISNTPNFTNCVRTSDHLPSHIFPRESEKKVLVPPLKKEKPKKRHEAQFTWSVKGKLFLFCICEFILTYELIWYEFISFESNVKLRTKHQQNEPPEALLDHGGQMRGRECRGAYSITGGDNELRGGQIIHCHCTSPLIGRRAIE